MPYRIAGIDVHKKMLTVVVSDGEGTANMSLNGGCLAAILNNCDRSPNGCSNKRSGKR